VDKSQSCNVRAQSLHVSPPRSPFHGGVTLDKDMGEVGEYWLPPSTVPCPALVRRSISYGFSATVLTAEMMLKLR